MKVIIDLDENPAQISEREILHRLLAGQKHMIHQLNEIRKSMSALSDLQAAVTQLASDLSDDTSAVIAAISHIGSPAATDAQLVPITAALASASATLKSNTANLNAAVAAIGTPPPPPPPVIADWAPNTTLAVGTQVRNPADGLFYVFTDTTGATTGATFNPAQFAAGTVVAARRR